jgi:hypothetical protein
MTTRQLTNVEREAVPSFQIHLCDPKSPLAGFGTSRLFSISEGQTGPKRSFRDISDIKCDVTELLEGVSLQDSQRAFEDLYKLFLHCVGGGDYIESL